MPAGSACAPRALRRFLMDRQLKERHRGPYGMHGTLLRPVAAVRQFVWQVDLFESNRDSRYSMDSLRTTVDIPRDLHRRLHEAAKLRGCSARQLILESIEGIVLEVSPRRPRHRLSLDRAPVPSRGHAFVLSSEQIHELIEFP